MANNKDAEPRADHELKDVSAGQAGPGKDLLPEEADAVAGAIPPPTYPASSDGPGPGVPPSNPDPGKNLEIETLEGAAAGTLTRTIRVKIEDADLNEPVD